MIHKKMMIRELAASPELLEDTASSSCSSVACDQEQGARDAISAMLHQESSYLCRDYLKASSNAKQQQSDDAKKGLIGRSSPVDVQTRSRVSRWMVSSISSAHLSPDTASAAISYLDRYLSSSRPSANRARNDRREYQRAAMGCLYVAIKVHESVEVDAKAMSRLSRGMLKKDDILGCEREILEALRWNLNGPTAGHFVDRIVDLLPQNDKAKEQLRRDARQQVSPSIMQDYSFVPLRRSTVAAAAVLNSLKGIPRSELSLEKRLRFVASMSSALQVDLTSKFVMAVRRRLVEVSVSNSLCEMSSLGGSSAKSEVVDGEMQRRSSSVSLECN